MAVSAKPSAFITGASYGVGAATALALAHAGYRIAISATRVENLDDTTARLAAEGEVPIRLALDLREQASIADAVTQVSAAFGQVDVLVNNAGANLRKRAVDVTWAEWDKVMAANLAGAFFLSRQLARCWIAQARPGAIVNIASTHGLVGAAERTVYGISKGALIQMTRMLAIEWAEHGIRVNAVAPGRLDTASPSRAERTGDAAYMAAMIARVPLHRLATAGEVAAAVCYLVSPLAASITGQTLVLDGGLTAA